MERAGAFGSHRTVLERRSLGRCRRNVCRHASGNGRCGADGIPVSPDRRTGDSDIASGAGFHDSGKGRKDGGSDERSYRRNS